jgi:hypothetical protein
MSQQPRKDPKSTTPPAKPSDEGKSGRVRFDERGQAVWEWAVQTGMFDRNASTQRIRALTEPPAGLEIAETPAPTPKPVAAAPATGNPYEPASVARPAKKGSTGDDPYSRGPARDPEKMTFNPYDRHPTRKP